MTSVSFGVEVNFALQSIPALAEDNNSCSCWQSSSGCQLVIFWLGCPGLYISDSEEQRTEEEIVRKSSSSFTCRNLRKPRSNLRRHSTPAVGTRASSLGRQVWGITAWVNLLRLYWVTVAEDHFGSDIYSFCFPSRPLCCCRSSVRPISTADNQIKAVSLLHANKHEKR